MNLDESITLRLVSEYRTAKRLVKQSWDDVDSAMPVNRPELRTVASAREHLCYHALNALLAHIETGV